MSESYASHPRTLGELRSDRTDDSASWSPRDLLIALLRDIDSGKEIPVDMLVIWRTPSDDGDKFVLTYRVATATPGAVVPLGMMARAAHLMNEAT